MRGGTGERALGRSLPVGLGDSMPGHEVSAHAEGLAGAALHAAHKLVAQALQEARHVALGNLNILHVCAHGGGHHGRRCQVEHVPLAWAEQSCMHTLRHTLAATVHAFRWRCWSTMLTVLQTPAISTRTRAPFAALGSGMEKSVCSCSRPEGSSEGKWSACMVVHQAHLLTPLAAVKAV